MQAAAHIEAVCAVRDIREIRVCGRLPDKARAFAARHAALTAAALVVVATPQEAAGCDVVCVVTGAHEPVIRGAWVRPGAHVIVAAHVTVYKSLGLIAQDLVAAHAVARLAL